MRKVIGGAAVYWRLLTDPSSDNHHNYNCCLFDLVLSKYTLAAVSHFRYLSGFFLDQNLCWSTRVVYSLYIFQVQIMSCFQVFFDFLYNSWEAVWYATVLTLSLLTLIYSLFLWIWNYSFSDQIKVGTPQSSLVWKCY